MKLCLMASVALLMLSASSVLAEDSELPVTDETVTYKLYHSYLTAEACVLWRKTSPDSLSRYKQFVAGHAPEMKDTLKKPIWEKAYKNTRVLREDRDLPITICLDNEADFKRWIDATIEVPVNPFSFEGLVKP